jgi:hypothetical protein
LFRKSEYEFYSFKWKANWKVNWKKYCGAPTANKMKRRINEEEDNENRSNKKQKSELIFDKSTTETSFPNQAKKKEPVVIDIDSQSDEDSEGDSDEDTNETGCDDEVITQTQPPSLRSNSPYFSNDEAPQKFSKGRKPLVTNESAKLVELPSLGNNIYL